MTYIDPNKLFEEVERSCGRLTFDNDSKRYRHEYRLYINEHWTKLEIFNLIKQKILFNNPTKMKTRKPIKEINNDIPHILRYLKKRVSKEQYAEIEKFCFEKL